MVSDIYLGYYGNPKLFLPVDWGISVPFALGEQFLPRLFQRPPEQSRERSVSSLLNLTNTSH